ncbi:hypothetical protein J6590_098445 [Homalodisca vitripennis]|nr:hypothetical protein J6590_098445 [Homalodisca vitripennis]
MLRSPDIRVPRSANVGGARWLTLADYGPAVYRQRLLFGAVGHVRQKRLDSLAVHCSS